MNYRYLLLVLITVVCFSLIAISQPRGNRVEMQLKRITEKVELTKEQTVKVKDLLQKAQDEIRAQFENSDGDREARREAMVKQMEKTDAEIIKLLTKKQKPKYDEYKKERRKEMQERMRERQ
ncbi:MAG TPA: hypothetical protein DCQ28_05380 [Bacteroidetes bacterium]|nr:hypothetical protein [Bacteroidota bacterium]